MSIGAIEKLKVLLPHWADHNQEHAREVRKWKAETEGSCEAEVRELLEAAAVCMDKAGELLKQAATKLGSEENPDSHHHHHS